ncbi:MAG: redoxin domain-containing protein [Vibrio sp.]
MSYSAKLKAGSSFPSINVSLMDGSTVELGKPQGDATWQAVFVYRGKHCPLCTRYLNQIEEFKQDFYDIGIDIIAVSADSIDRCEEHCENLNVSFPIGYGLTVEQMKTLGLYISEPRTDNESPREFSEPGLFIVNEKGELQVVDIANHPFTRPEIRVLVKGLAFIRSPENNYPIRGMLDY